MDLEHELGSKSMKSKSANHNISSFYALKGKDEQQESHILSIDREASREGWS